MGTKKWIGNQAYGFYGVFAAFFPRQLDSFCDLNNLTMGTKINSGNKSPKWTQQKSGEKVLFYLAKHLRFYLTYYNNVCDFTLLNLTILCNFTIRTLTIFAILPYLLWQFMRLFKSDFRSLKKSRQRRICWKVDTKALFKFCHMFRDPILFFVYLISESIFP